MSRTNFASRRGRDWSFFGEKCDDQGQPIQVWLRPARRTPIKRHVKVKGDANPYDPATLPMKHTSNDAKKPICRIRFGVLVPFVFSGTNNAGSALCAMQESLGSRGGACTTASPVPWVSSFSRCEAAFVKTPN